MKFNAELAKTVAQLAMGPKWEVGKADVADDGNTLTFAATSKDGAIELKGKIKAPPQEELPLDDDDEDKVTPINKGAH